MNIKQKHFLGMGLIIIFALLSLSFFHFMSNKGFIFATFMIGLWFYNEYFNYIIINPLIYRSGYYQGKIDLLESINKDFDRIKKTRRKKRK